MWDEDHLYAAMRSPLREGERVLQRFRDRDRDINVVFDDSYEIWIDAGSETPDGQPMYLQFLANFAGAKFDALHLPAVGNMRMSWDANKEGWQVRDCLSKQLNAWECEVAIPRQSVYIDEPFSDQGRLRIFLARNFKRPWEQNSFGGVGGFSIREGYTQCILSREAPAVHLLQVADPANKTFGVQVGVFGKETDAIKWLFESDAGIRRSGTLTGVSGKLRVTDPGLDLDEPGKGSFRVRILSEHGKTTYLDWASKREFANLPAAEKTFADTGDMIDLCLRYNPVKEYVRVRGDFINFDRRHEIGEFYVFVKDDAGKTIKGARLAMDDLAYVKGVLKLQKLRPGDYAATLLCRDKMDRTIVARESKFAVKDLGKLPWWNTEHGNIERVISPWTPVTCRHGECGVWGRTMRIGPAALPLEVFSQKQSLLAAPCRLEAVLADGTVTEARGIQLTQRLQENHRNVVDVGSRLGNLDITSRLTTEFDGMYKIEMTITPREATPVRSLEVVIPFANDVAEYLHACGEAPRYGYFQGFLSARKQGRIWDCRTVDGQPMAVGSFIPYVWVGNAKGGLCFFADSDRGWAPDDRVPAIEVRRDDKHSTDLILNLMGAPFTIDRPRTIVFALQASPVKPLFKGWRMDSWWAGDTFEDYSFVGEKGGHFVFGSIPFTLDRKRCREWVEKRKGSTNAFIFGFKKYAANVVPYFEHIHMGKQFVPDYDYFAESWENTMNQGRGLCYEGSLQDFMIHHIGEWSKATGIEGYYLDNLYPLADNNLEAGRGYLLPDGRIQPTFQMFDTRRYFLRLRAVFAEQGHHHKIVFHMTNNMILPWIGAADIAFDGEDHVIYPGQKDFMDRWSLERMRNVYHGQWGSVFNFMHEYQGAWDRRELLRAMRAYTGMVVLHDALPSGNTNGMNTPVWIGRDRFGIEADEVRFLPYWDADTGVRSLTKEVLVAGWLRPAKLLLVVVNKGNKDENAVVELDWARLGLPPSDQCEAVDAEAGCQIKGWDPDAKKHLVQWDADEEGALSRNADGQLVIPVRRHNYRQVIVRKRDGEPE